MLTLPESEGFLCRKDVARMLGVCTRTVRRLEQAGKLKALALNKRLIRYKVVDVRKYLESVYA